jgi:hypothetical protein
MRQDWDELFAKETPEKQQYYAALRERCNAFEVPRREAKAIVIQPEDLDWFLLACILIADVYRLTSYQFSWFEKDLLILKKRVKNPVLAWYPLATLHMRDTVTNKNMHLRLIESVGYQYGA